MKNPFGRAAAEERNKRREAADLLEKAADWMDEHGWVQANFVSFGNSYDADGRPVVRGACAYGAMRIAAGMTPLQARERGPIGAAEGEETYRAAEAELERCIAAFDPTVGTMERDGEKRADIISWNDRQGQDKEKVLALFRRCAERVRKGKAPKASS